MPESRPPRKLVGRELREGKDRLYSLRESNNATSVWNEQASTMGVELANVSTVASETVMNSESKEVGEGHEMKLGAQGEWCLVFGDSTIAGTVLESRSKKSSATTAGTRPHDPMSGTLYCRFGAPHVGDEAHLTEQKIQVKILVVCYTWILE